MKECLGSLGTSTIIGYADHDSAQLVGSDPVIVMPADNLWNKGLMRSDNR